VLLSRVLLTKNNGDKRFIIVDGAMNDLIRPTLYGGHHEVSALRQKSETVTADVVGPVCETGDYFALNREVPALAPGELIAIRNAGAYGFVMASNYNTRPRAPEVLVEGQTWRIVRERESLEDLVRGEHL
jgi:diaminopimelate decarboxylase